MCLCMCGLDICPNIDQLVLTDQILRNTYGFLHISIISYSIDNRYTCV